jgi:hypothetical protein
MICHKADEYYEIILLFQHDTKDMPMKKIVTTIFYTRHIYTLWIIFNEKAV